MQEEKEVFSKMNAEKLKKDIERAIEVAKSIHDDMVEKLTVDNADSATMIRELEEITSRLSTLVWYLGHISEEVDA